MWIQEARMIWHRSRPVLSAVCVAGMLCACVSLPAEAAAEQDDPIVEVSWDGTHVTMRDAATGAPLMMPRHLPLHDGRRGGPLIPTFRFTPHPDGFDLEATYTNTTNREQDLGDLFLHTFTLGPEINIPDFRFAGDPVQATFASPPSWGHEYPRDLYSPVAVLANRSHAIGVSIMYPILEYKHDVLIAPRTQGGRMAEGEGGQGWQLRIGFSDPRGNRPHLVEPARLQPGETRTYMLAVRVTRNPNEWVRTLLPYRDYFRSTYGEVEYTRRTDPVLGLSIATSTEIRRDNPLGWARRYRGFRPDENGFAPWADEMIGDRTFDRFMLWAPSGLYPEPERNYPFHFVSPLENEPNLRTAFDPAVGLPRVANAGKQLGLWWGHSGWFAPSWDSPEYVPFDPSNPQHRQGAFRELDAAVRAGATYIGLDAFSHRAIRIWDALPWLEELRRRYPTLTFIIEPKPSDIMHRVTPCYYRGWVFPQTANTYEDVNIIDSPFYLADLVNPGHETWAALRWDMYPRYFGHRATQQQMRADIEEAARFGFVPLIHTPIQMDDPPHAQESWLWSVPQDLPEPPPPGNEVAEVEAPDDEPVTTPPAREPAGQSQSTRNASDSVIIFRGGKIVQKRSTDEPARTRTNAADGPRLIRVSPADLAPISSIRSSQSPSLVRTLVLTLRRKIEDEQPIVIRTHVLVFRNPQHDQE